MTLGIEGTQGGDSAHSMINEACIARAYQCDAVGWLNRLGVRDYGGCKRKNAHERCGSWACRLAL